MIILIYISSIVAATALDVTTHDSEPSLIVDPGAQFNIGIPIINPDNQITGNYAIIPGSTFRSSVDSALSKDGFEADWKSGDFDYVFRSKETLSKSWDNQVQPLFGFLDSVNWAQRIVDLTRFQPPDPVGPVEVATAYYGTPPQWALRFGDEILDSNLQKRIGFIEDCLQNPGFWLGDTGHTKKISDGILIPPTTDLVLIIPLKASMNEGTYNLDITIPYYYTTNARLAPGCNIQPQCSCFKIRDNSIEWKKTIIVRKGPSNAPSDEQILIDKMANWRYTLNPTGNFYDLDFDSSAWPLGKAPFSDAGTCPQITTGYTKFPLYSTLCARYDFELDKIPPSGRLYLGYDNDIAVYLNGINIFSKQKEGCGDYWNDEIAISGLRIGKNTLVCTVKDRGGSSFFDAKLTAENSGAGITQPGGSVQNGNKLMSDISGKWKGTLLEGSAKFPYSLDISTSDGSIIGKSKIGEGTYYAIMDISGSLSNDVLSLKETDFVEHHHGSDWRYVLKNVLLNIDDRNSGLLEGSWNCADCDQSEMDSVRGTLSLTREKNNAW